MKIPSKDKNENKYFQCYEINLETQLPKSWSTVELFSLDGLDNK